MKFLEPKFVVPGFLIAAAAVLNIGIVRGESSVHRYFELEKSRELLEDAVGQLKDQNGTLENEIAKLRESPEYARKVLKDKYHVTDENEKIVFFAD